MVPVTESGLELVIEAGEPLIAGGPRQETRFALFPGGKKCFALVHERGMLPMHRAPFSGCRLFHIGGRKAVNR
jgi:hypothetical protein